MCSLATFWCCGIFAQFGLTIWVLVDAVQSLFYSDDSDSGIECPGKVTDWAYWIFVWCILSLLNTYSNRKKEDHQFEEFIKEQIGVVFCTMIVSLVFGLVTQFHFWNLCGGSLNGTVEKYMYMQYGMVAWSLCLLLGIVAASRS